MNIRLQLVFITLSLLSSASFAQMPKLKKFCEGLEQDIAFREEKTELVKKQLVEINLKIKNLEDAHEDTHDEEAHRKFIAGVLDSLTAESGDECLVSSPSDVNKTFWKGCSVSCLQKAQQSCQATLARLEESEKSFSGKRAISSESRTYPRRDRAR